MSSRRRILLILSFHQTLCASHSCAWLPHGHNIAALRPGSPVKGRKQRVRMAADGGEDREKPYPFSFSQRAIYTLPQQTSYYVSLDRTEFMIVTEQNWVVGLWSSLDWNLIFHALKESSADAGRELWYVTVDMNGKYHSWGTSRVSASHRNQGVCEPHSLLAIGFHWHETLMSFSSLSQMPKV